MNEKIFKLSEKVGQLLKNKGLKLAIAESCTGGLVAAAITDISGSSEYFDRGFVTYSNEAKQEALGVKKNTLEEYGAVSLETVGEMALGVLRNSNAQISIAISGIAGPTGGSDEKPVGTVCFAIASTFASLFTICKIFSGNREEIREEATKFALKKLIDCL